MSVEDQLSVLRVPFGVLDDADQLEGQEWMQAGVELVDAKNTAPIQNPENGTGQGKPRLGTTRFLTQRQGNGISLGLMLELQDTVGAFSPVALQSTAFSVSERLLAKLGIADSQVSRSDELNHLARFALQHADCGQSPITLP